MDLQMALKDAEIRRLRGEIEVVRAKSALRVCSVVVVVVLVVVGGGGVGVLVVCGSDIGFQWK